MKGGDVMSSTNDRLNFTDEECMQITDIIMVSRKFSAINENSFMLNVAKDITKECGLRVFLYMFFSDTDSDTCQQHNKNCEKKTNLNRSTFNDGINNLHECGYIKRISEDVWELRKNAA